MPLTKVRRGGTDTGITDASDATAITIDSSENVGIGVTAPSDSTNNGDNLVIGGESNVGMSFLSNATSGNGAIYFADGTSGTAAYRGILSYSHSDDAMDFGTASTAARVRINSSGNVGIGTTSPSENLHINNTSGNSIVRIQTGSATSRTQVYGYDNSGNINYALGSNNNTNAEFWNYKNGYLRFATNSTERIRINSSGQTFCHNGIAFRPLAHYILTTSYQDICEIDTGSGDAGRGFILAVSSENNYQQHWNIQVSQNDISTHFFGGDSGHTHSKDVQWRKNNSHIQAKRSLSTGRALALYCAVGACVLDFDS